MFKKNQIFKIFLLTLILTSSFKKPIRAEESPTVTSTVTPQASPSPSLEEELLEGKIVKIETYKISRQETKHEIQVLITKGSLQNKKINLTRQETGESRQILMQPQDTVIIEYTKNLSTEQENFHIVDVVRREPLLWLFAIFFILALLVARWQGLTSFIGMAISFLVITKFVIPSLLNGNNPTQTVITALIILIPGIFILAHGFNKKTLIAIMGTFLSLIITFYLAKYFISWAALTGYTSDEAGFIQSFTEQNLDMVAVLLTGITVSLLGILDDITVAQTSVVEQLRKTSPSLSQTSLFNKAMQVGQDHIASMINTLILVYAGSSLPLLLLFHNNPLPFAQIVNYEFVAEEIVRSLVSSIGLIIAVPITTYLAVILYPTLDRYF